MNLHAVTSWQLHARDIAELPDSYASDILSDASCSISPSHTAPFQLPLFTSKVLTAARHGDTPEAVPPFTIDSVCFTGGLTWKMDCLQQGYAPTDLLSLATATDILAICVHPKGTTRNKAGQELQGPGIIQIWAIPNTPASEWCPDGAPTYLLGIAHPGHVTWDAKWSPDPSHLLEDDGHNPFFFDSSSAPPPPSVPTLGLLAAVLGDGTIQVLSVPRPASCQPPRAAAESSSSGSSHQQPLPGCTCSIQPHVVVTKQQLSGSVASCIAWQSTAPHTHLIVGCWDGTAVLLKLPRGRGGFCQGLAQFKADEGIRTVAWTPPPATPSVDGLERHLLLTSGASGRIKLWDTRDLQQPLIEKLMFRCQIMEAGWAGGPHGGIYCCMEDGLLRVLPLDTRYLAQTKEAGSIYKGEGMGCLWAVGISAATGLAAIAGEDGVVGLLTVENNPDTRRRKPHIAIGGFEASGGVLHLVDPQVQSADNWGLFSGGSWYRGYKERKNLQKVPSWPEDAQTVYCLRFGGAYEGSAWVAYGGAAGVVRVQRVAAVTVTG